jgi:hypothetical protein
MKQSEELLQLAREEENDLKSMGMYIKALRASRSEKFEDGWLLPLSNKYEIKHENYKYSITTQDYGIIDFFPKANKLLIRKDNNWIKPGLKWIINNLFNE